MLLAGIVSWSTSYKETRGNHVLKRSRGKGRICLFNQGREAPRFSRVYFHKIKGGIINYDYNEDTFFEYLFFGGGTDFAEFYKEHGGAVLSTAIDKYCYVNVRHLPRFF